MGLADVMSRLVSLASWMGQLLVLVNLPLVMAGMVHVPWSVVVLLIFAPTLMALIQLGLSRTREYDADRVAADLTGDPEVDRRARQARAPRRPVLGGHLPARQTHPRTPRCCGRIRR